MTKDLSTQLDRVGQRLSRIKSQTLHKLLLGSLGDKSAIRRPIVLRGASNIFIGDNTWIRDGGRLEAIHRPGEAQPRLDIGNRVLIEQNVHIICCSSVVIEDDVMIAAGASIVDTIHPNPGEVSDNVGRHICGGETFVKIGSGSMLGVGVVVLPNVTIGTNCLIGANSVVTHDIPDNSVAAGSPARILRSIAL